MRKRSWKIDNDKEEGQMNRFINDQQSTATNRRADGNAPTCCTFIMCISTRRSKCISPALQGMHRHVPLSILDFSIKNTSIP